MRRLQLRLNAETRKVIVEAIFAEFEKITREQVTRRALKQK